MEQLKLEISGEFYLEEEKCGYVVSEKLKKVWAVELDLLNELLRVANKHGIKVVVFAGTLLGAIRHNGFIPWDDDVDVAMDRDNYEKLLKVAAKEFKEPYFFQNCYTDKEYFFGYSRLRNSSTTGAITWNMSKTYNNGIYIDVFVLDGLIDDTALLQKQIFKRKILERIISTYSPHSLKSKICCYTIDKFIPRSFWIKQYNKCISQYTDHSSKLAMCTHGGPDFLEKYWMYKLDFDEIMTVEYEGIQVPIPKNYDQILTNMYGDYMAFPPIEKRGEWHNGIIEFDPDTPYKDYMERKLSNKSQKGGMKN